MSKVIAVIVTFNPSINELKEQFDALSPQVDGIVYVDNASDKYQLPISESGKVSIILNKKNLGLGEAQNIGIREAIKLNASHILLLDDDSTPSSNMVQNLLDNEAFLLSKGHNLGLVGARIKNLYSQNIDLTAGIQFSGVGIKHVQIGNEPISVSYCIASGSLIPIKVFEAVGGINERMFIDGLDVEWCLRALSKGYEIFASHNAFLGHRLGNGNKDRILSHSPLREYYITRNSIYLSRLSYIPTGYRIRRFFMSFARASKSLISGNFKFAQMAWKGILEGMIM